MNTVRLVLVVINLLLCGINSWLVLHAAKSRRRDRRLFVVLGLFGFCWGAVNVITLTFS